MTLRIVARLLIGGGRHRIFPAPVSTVTRLMEASIVNKSLEKIEWRPESLLKSDSRYAVLLLNNELGQFKDDERSQSIFESLWNSANLRVCVDGGANFLPRGTSILPPDIISGDLDSVTDETLSHFQSKGSEIIPTPDQDETDFTKAIQVVLSRQDTLALDAIIAVNRVGGRPDQLLSNFHSLHYFAEKVPVLLYDIGSSISWVLQQGAKHVIHKPLASGESSKNTFWCSLVPLMGDSVLTTQGLKWNLHQSTLKFGTFISTSNEFDSLFTSAEIISNRTILWSMKDCLQLDNRI